MSKQVLQKRISEYRTLIGIDEGLSFSDQYDDSISGDVKPPQMLCPMEENDEIQPTEGPIRGHGWLDKYGRYYKAENGHYSWGAIYLKSKNISYNPENVYNQLYDLGFIRIHTGSNCLHFEYENASHHPNSNQMKVLKNAAIEIGRNLADDTKDEIINIDELEENTIKEIDYPIQAKDLFKRAHTEAIKTKSPGIFIVGMKPEQKEEFKSALAKLFSHLKDELKLKTLPKIHLLEDETNAKKLLGKTGYYDYTTAKICLYMTGRHPKDILRSFAHEVIHHWQHENKQLEKSDASEGANKDPQYAQNDPWMRQMEKQAYLLGNMMFRDWEDDKKSQDRKNNKKLAERTYKIGKEYPPKKPDYRG